MAIKQEPFVRYHEEKQADSFAIRLSKDGSERELLEKAKKMCSNAFNSFWWRVFSSWYVSFMS